MTTLAEFMIIAGAENRPPMLEKSLYDSWKSRMEFYMENRENERMILDSIQNDPLVWPTVVQEDGLPPDVYAIVNHHKVAKEIWDKVKLLIQQMKLSLQEKECKLYDKYDKFSFVKGETLYQYYCRFAQLINNMNVINMSMRPVQVNTKFLNSLPPEWRDDPNACLNKAMDFLIPVASSRVTVQQVQGRQGQSYAGNSYKVNATSSGGNNAGGQGRVVQCYNCQGGGHKARQCIQPKRPRNAAWFKEKAILAKAQEAGQILDEEQLAFLANLGIPDEVPDFEPYHTDMDNQGVHAMQGFEQSPIADFIDNEITSDSNIIPGSICSNNAYVNKAISFYDDTYKQALGYQNLFYLKKAQRIKKTLYDGSVISSQHAACPVIDDEETDFGRKLSDEQAFWLQTSHPKTNQSTLSPVKIEAPQELPKVILVNTSLKKLKYHPGQFDTMVKKQITPDAITEGERGFEHTKTVFLNEIIPFLKTLKHIFNVFDKDLLNELTEVEVVFNQMEAAVQ
ncbi:retrovirus-related pol polyprotein from transposon TNT 1-94 [Tanacetum coccineum]